MNEYTITTAIAYPNGRPHLGHALEYVQADFFARYRRQQGKDVFFLTGLDEHGLKIQQAAAKAGMEAQAFVDQQSAVFYELDKKLDISYDRFIRTTDADHTLAAQAMWRMCFDAGDIYSKRYQAWYDIKEEEFLGRVEEFPDPSAFSTKPEFIEKIDEENYFFRLSKYTTDVLALLETGQIKIYPESRAQELINMIKEKGLQDVSISRDASKLDWGIPVPNDPSQVMYVWFDALTNYLTPTCGIDGRGYLSPSTAWPADIHCVGKDIFRFHGLMWPGMLLSAGLPLPKAILVHGFFTVDGAKMSKSLANGTAPIPLLDTYGADTVRWFFLKEVPTQGDADFTEERLREVYGADLANDFGNLVSRVWSMCQKYCGGKVPEVGLESVRNLEQTIVAEAWTNYHAAIAGYDASAALHAAASLVVFCNRRIDEQKPWAMAKDPARQADLYELLYELLEIIRAVSLMYGPAIPTASQRVLTEVLATTERSQEWGGLKPGAPLGTTAVILFPRLEA